MLAWTSKRVCIFQPPLAAFSSSFVLFVFLLRRFLLCVGFATLLKNEFRKANDAVTHRAFLDQRTLLAKRQSANHGANDLRQGLILEDLAICDVNLSLAAQTGTACAPLD